MLDGSPHRRSHAGLWFAAATVVSLLLLLASRTPQALSLQEVTSHALDPVRGAIGGVGSGITGFFATIGEIDRLRSENDRLRAQLAGAEARLAELREAAAENAELRGLLGLTTSLRMDLLQSASSGRSEQLHLEVGIDAGTDDGGGSDAGRGRRRWRRCPGWQRIAAPTRDRFRRDANRAWWRSTRGPRWASSRAARRPLV
jgi:cell shape-determining protein MreC